MPAHMEPLVPTQGTRSSPERLQCHEDAALGAVDKGTKTTKIQLGGVREAVREEVGVSSV